MFKGKTSSTPPPKQDDGSGISSPYNPRQLVHVDDKFNWEGNAEDIFTIEKQIGKGAYGEVYRASFKSTKVVVAAKQVHLEEHEAADIKREIDILKACNNPSIVNYYGSIIGNKSKDKKPASGEFKLPEEGSVLWILMDYCAAGSVKDVITKTHSPLTEDQAAAVLSGALKGLIYLHENNIIHRDIKAANILLTEDGTPKLADFGISTKLDPKSTGKAKTMIGTPYWMAPEVMGEAPYNNKIDIWSLGITAIEMVEMDPPNWDLKPFQLMLKLPKDDPPTFKNPAKFSKEFADFVKACLQKDPAKRPNARNLLTHPFIINRMQKGREFLQQVINKTASIANYPKAKTPSPPGTMGNTASSTAESKSSTPPKLETKTNTTTAPPSPTKPPQQPAAVVKKGHDITLDGKWAGESAGGCINHLSFRKNPQFYLHVTKDTKVNFTLIQDNTLHHIGFYIAKAESPCRLLTLSAKELVEKAKFQNVKEVSLELPITAGNYIIVPCTFAPKDEGGFKLNVKAVGATGEVLHMNAIEGGFAQLSGEWTSTSAGGCVNFPSWRSNPQYVLEVFEEGTVAIALEAELDFNSPEKPHIGFYLVKGTDNQQKKLIITPSDIITDCKFASKSAVSAKIALKPSDGPVIIIPSTYNPGIQGKFTVATSGKSITMQRLSDTMFKSHTVKGEWKGKTAGGCKNYDSWADNPRFILIAAVPGTISVVLTQSQKEKFNGIGFYVIEDVASLKDLTIKHDSSNKVVAKSKFVTGLEVANDVALPAKGTYIIVPTTFQPGIEDTFELTVYFKEEFILKGV